MQTTFYPREITRHTDHYHDISISRIHCRQIMKYPTCTAINKREILSLGHNLRENDREFAIFKSGV